MDTATARPSVFVSYNGADRAWAEWIAWVLEEDGHKVVIQAWDFRPGSNFVLEVDRTAAGADKTVLVLSDNYLRAEFTHPEWAAAFARDPRGLDRRVYLPFPRLGDLFTGRQEELESLTGTGTAAITQSTALSGLGGIGKTRLAVEYAWRSGNRYTAVWFVRADSPGNLCRNLAALAAPELMNLPERKAGVEEDTIAAVKQWLREHPGWLMILDNVDTPEAARVVLEVLPSLSKGRVLITSRLTTWPATVRPRSLDTLSREEAVDFLLHRTEEGRTKATDDDRQALALAEALDGLPLALEQAAAFILRRRLRLADYLRAWEQGRSDLLKWYDPRAMEYPASVAVTWKQTFDRLSPTSAVLLRLMAFLAPDPIPVDMLEKGTEDLEQAAQRLCEETGKAPDGLSVQTGLDELADYSLVTRQDGEMVVVHRMVQEVLRSQIPGAKKDWVEWALRIVSRAFPSTPSDVRTWPACDCLRPHATKVAASADEEAITDPTSQLMNQLGLLFLNKGLYAEAEPLMRRALHIDEMSLGREHPKGRQPAQSFGCFAPEHEPPRRS